jgi:hypothetical protein
VHSGFSDKPEPISNPAVANWRAPELPGTSSDGLQQCVTRWSNSDRKQQLYGRIQQVFLQDMDKPVFRC